MEKSVERKIPISLFFLFLHLTPMLRVFNTSDVNDRNIQRLQKVQPNILIF